MILSKAILSFVILGKTANVTLLTVNIGTPTPLRDICEHATSTQELDALLKKTQSAGGITGIVLAYRIPLDLLTRLD